MNAITRAMKLGSITTLATLCVLLLGSIAFADGPAGNPKDQVAKFRQLGSELPTPNIYRTGSGAPGPAYWQQQADFVIDVTLDETKKRISASEKITYTNTSPDALKYIWLALDQNRFKDGSLARESTVASAVGSRRGDGSGNADRYSFSALRYHQHMADREYGFEFKAVEDSTGRALPYVINDTMMRIDLPTPIVQDDTFEFTITWEHNIIDEETVGGRGGYEYFPDTDTYIYALAQWFPRLAAYTDYTGWQNKQFLGRGEFTLEFGNYEVNITVPEDHIVSATGVLQNPRQVLSAEQRRRLDKAGTEKPVYIVTPEEARENEKSKSRGTKTWRFKADNVRDFAWSSSRKYIWDAMLFEQDDDEVPVVTAMSFFPNEADPIWSQYSTQAVAHTMDVYNRFSFNYPYPTAQSVNAWERGGMEYPMITFNGYRPTEDEKSGEIVYSRATKYGLIGVIIHEIGHIYFPMVVNSDERRWTWMDEGLNTFLEYLAEYEWEENFPISRWGEPNPLDDISRYMKSSNQVPIMTQSDSVLQFGPNAYSKPAAALMVLRETVMGRELFDFAFREYSRRWKFKRPTPADFFRTMEDASAVDLDWFWRGWFFDTDHVDMGISDVRAYTISTQDPEEEFDKDRRENMKDHPESIVQKRNREEGISLRIDNFEGLEDLYNEKDKFTVTNKDLNKYSNFLDELEPWERKSYDRALEEGQYIYFIDFENHGGLISPLPLTLTYANGETEDMMIPAEIWRRNSNFVTKLLVREKRIASIALDPAHQTADADYGNNNFPPVITPSRLELYKSSRKSKNLMADMLVELKRGDTDEDSMGKDVPLKSGEMTGERKKSKSLKKMDDAPAHRSQNTNDGTHATPSKSSEKKPLSPADKSALRRTLKRLMGRE